MLSELKIEPARKAIVAQAVGTWEFSAHDFDSDELLYAALVMLEHALKMPELERWRISTGAFRNLQVPINLRLTFDLQTILSSSCSLAGMHTMTLSCITISATLLTSSRPSFTSYYKLASCPRTLILMAWKRLEPTLHQWRLCSNLSTP